MVTPVWDTIARYKRFFGGGRPQRGLGFPLLAREVRGTYRFKVLSLVHICSNVFKPAMPHIPTPPVPLP